MAKKTPEISDDERLSYEDQDVRFKRVGERIVEYLVGLREPDWHLAKNRELALSREARPRGHRDVQRWIGDFNASKFPTEYRNAWPGQDELFSTSSVRELIAGIKSGLQAQNGKVAKDRIREVQALLDRHVTQLSYQRVPTEFSGYHTVSSHMAHPTSVFKKKIKNKVEKLSASIWSNQRKGAHISQHREDDLERREAVIVAMEEEVATGNAGALVIEAGLRRAMEFSVNAFDGPALSRSVFLAEGKQAKALEANAVREEIKKKIVALGGKQEQGDDRSRARMWHRDASKRDVSPNRDDVVAPKQLIVNELVPNEVGVVAPRFAVGRVKTRSTSTITPAGVQARFEKGRVNRQVLSNGQSRQGRRAG